MTQAIRFGDLSEAKAAFDGIRAEQGGTQELSLDARFAFDALGEAIESGSLLDAADGLRLFRLVLECKRQNRSRGRTEPLVHDDSQPAETLRSGVVPAFFEAVGDELPETATLPSIDVAR
jgi:hypothetical protein